jgi:hypothetical protein
MWISRRPYEFALLNCQMDAPQHKKFAAAGVVRFFKISKLD